MNTSHALRFAAASAMVLSLAACVSGGSSASAGERSSLVGTPYRGATAGASVCVHTLNNFASDNRGAQILAQTGSTAFVSNGCAITASDGSYTFVLPQGTAGDLLVEVSGGTSCTDRSAYQGGTCAGGGSPVAMRSANLTAVVTAPSSGTDVSVPLTLLTTVGANAMVWSARQAPPMPWPAPSSKSSAVASLAR